MTTKRTRGFAAMDPEKQRAIASKGGKAAHAKGKAHRFTTEEASEAGRKGGRAAHARGTAHRFTAAEASEAGRKGGSSRSATSRQHHEAGTDKTPEMEQGPVTGTPLVEQPAEMRPTIPGGAAPRHTPDRPGTEPAGRGNEQHPSRHPAPAPQSTNAPLSMAP